MPKIASGLCALLLALATGSVGAELRLPPGFRIAVWAEGVRDARTLVLADDGTVFVGTRSAGRVYALRDADGDGRAERRWTVAEGLQMPNGIAWRDGSLYVADLDRLLRYDGLPARLDAPPAPRVLRDDLSDERHHGWRFIAFGPDGKLYLALGAPCNVCERLAEIRRMDADGRNEEVVARGIRNSVGFAWRPGTTELWLTDNGRDWLGDDRPPDEIDIVTAPGRHYGYPYCHGRDIPDPEFGRGKSCADYAPPALELGAHVAPLGIAFYTGTQFPAEYRGDAFVAEHGSWNRSRKVGYRVIRVRIGADGRPLGYEPFAEGWLDGEHASGRPSYLLQLPDGSLLLSDDAGGRLYRISYRGP